MHWLATFVERYPIVIVLAMVGVIVLFTLAADWFVGLAERDAPMDATEALSKAHADAITQHARRLRIRNDLREATLVKPDDVAKALRR